MTAEHVKHATSGLLAEAAALRWLAEAEVLGGLHVARVISASDTQLIEERIPTAQPTREMVRAAGRALAYTHAAGARAWGAPPDGWSGEYIIGHSQTPTVPSDRKLRFWGEFWAEYRIENYLERLPHGFFSSSDLLLFDKLCCELRSGLRDAEQPALVRAQGHAVARVHGDLWAGNLIWTQVYPCGAALIDPMAHGGHAEEDLALLALFGSAYLDDFIAAYDEASPLAPAWFERVPLMQLAPLLQHCLLFGESYKSQTLLALKRCL